MKIITVMAALSVAGLSGCMSFGAQAPQRYYVLEVPAALAAAAAADRAAVKPQNPAPRAATLLVAPTTASGFYESQDIVYSRTPGTRAYYQLHAWTERPGRRLTELLVMRLDRAGSFRNVVAAGSGARADVVLDSRLLEFYHDAVHAPGSVRVSVAVELTDPSQRLLLARRVFTRSAPVATYDAPGAVLAFNHVVAAVLDEIAAWVESALPR